MQTMARVGRRKLACSAVSSRFYRFAKRATRGLWIGTDVDVFLALVTEAYIREALRCAARTSGDAKKLDAGHVRAALRETRHLRRCATTTS
jgi:hypothetical protein